jgi:energy-coupling factor transporter ATP-binding protein EcfA2
MFCPECKVEYRPGFTRCSDCDVDLVAQLPEPRQASLRLEGQLKRIWLSDEREPCVYICARLRAAEIPFNVTQTKRQYFWNVVEHYEILVQSEFFDKAKAIAEEGCLDFSDSFEDQRTMELPEAETCVVNHDYQKRRWRPQDATVLISGGTGTGKTTLLSILGKFIPKEERVLVIEDTAEIQLAQENLVRFEARREQNGLPAVPIRDLLRAALRHRPDRIVLGEIRGGEAFDLLQLLNTGHSGTISTIHANSAQQGLARFTSCVLQSGIELPYRAIKTNIADSLNVVVHVERRPGRRYISEVLLINRYHPDADLFDYGVVFLAKQDNL